MLGHYGHTSSTSLNNSHTINPSYHIGESPISVSSMKKAKAGTIDVVFLEISVCDGMG